MNSMIRKINAKVLFEGEVWVPPLKNNGVKFIYSEKATKFCEISTVDLTVTAYVGQIYGGDFAKTCGLLRIYELYE